MGYTSDHVRRDISVATGGVTWKGFTWNLQERCYSKADGPRGYANNPLNCTEDQNQYETRKKRQIDEMVDVCKKKRFDFGLLQEVDFCFSEYYMRKDPDEKIPDWLPASLDAMLQYFSQAMNNIGFKFISYEDKEIVIIYKAHKLKFINSCTHLTYKSKRASARTSDKDVLFLGTFRDNDGDTVKLGSMHGNYNEDYSESIPKLLEDLKKEKDCVILGGDTNHPSGYKMPNLLTPDEHDITNFFTNYAEINGRYTKVQLEDTRCGLFKAYDGFFVTCAEGEVIISGSHVWSKNAKPNGEDEYPVLLTTTLTNRILL